MTTAPRGRPHQEYSIVRVISPVTDISLCAAAGAVVGAVPVGAEGTIVDIHDQPGLPLAYQVEFTSLPDEKGSMGRVDTILHDELALVWQPE